MNLADVEVHRPPGRPRSLEADRAILRATVDLLADEGYGGVTMEGAAARAGVGKATVYRRWPSKDDLAVAAMERLYAIEMPQPDTGSIRTDLAESYRAVLSFVGSAEGLAYLRMAVAESVRDERIAALYRTATERAEEQARQMYLRGIQRGEVREDVDLDWCVQWLQGLVVARVITNRPLPTVEDVPGLVELTVRGIVAD